MEGFVGYVLLCVSGFLLNVMLVRFFCGVTADVASYVHMFLVNVQCSL